MPWEALLWSALALGSPSLANIVWPRVEKRLRDWAAPLGALGPWAHGVAPAYLALITGAILSRDAGLRGHDALAWVGGALACALIVVIVGSLRHLQSAPAPWPDPLRALADEPRWALYRAAGALWTWSHAFGAAIGLGLSLTEWALARRLWQRDSLRRPEAWAVLTRVATSTLFFVLTRNFWLTALSQSALMALLGKEPRGALRDPLVAAGGSDET